MFQNKQHKFATVIAMLMLSSPFASMAEVPMVQTKGALIYLADNLNEEAKLGWCIDTEGKGFSDQLQSHSCKPEGADTQFSYDVTSGMIKSVAYEGKCMALSEPENTVNPFGLLDCVKDDVTQQFIYDTSSMEFRISADESKCVTVAEKINDAGPYQSRDLIFAACADLDSAFKQWVVRN